LEETIRQIAVWALPVLFAVVLHEVAHGWMAFRLGDTTAARMGRLTLNPIAHIDLFGSILLPLLLLVSSSPFVFGYAKPVPVNFYNLRNPKRDMVWVAAAGPAMNLLLALAAILFLKLTVPLLNAPGTTEQTSILLDFVKPITVMAGNAVIINIVLAVFNTFPLPPLDGGRILVGLLPELHATTVARIEPFGFIILLVLLMTRALDQVIGPPMNYLLHLYFALL
jgi:Zn-dependent protease